MDTTTDTREGTVTRLVPDKGFGFIEVPGQHDLFFHATALINAAFHEVEVGHPVRFVATRGERGPRAEQVELLR